MGVNCATEIFQQVIQHEVLRGLEGTRNLVDDVLVLNKTNEHDERLITVLQRFERCGLTCCFEQARRDKDSGLTLLVFRNTIGVEIGQWASFLRP